MKERIQLLLLYYIFWVIYFISAKVIFLGYHIAETKRLTLELIFGVFQNGIQMDISAAAYLSFIPFLIITFSHFIKKSKLETILFSYTLVFVFIITLLIVIDLEAYNVWRFRLDETPLKYLASPREALASAKSSPIIQLFISYLLLMAVASYFVYRIISNQLDNWKFIKKMPFIPIAFALTLLLLIPMRGIKKEPLTPGQLYFSNNNFANIATLNTAWNFTFSLIKRFDQKLNPYTYLPRNEIKRSIKELYPTINSLSPKLTELNSKSNVLIIIVESLSNKILDKKVEDVLIAPNLSSLKNSSIYFSNAYASGEHTEKGLVSILNGYPSLPTKSIIYEKEKVKKLPFLTKEFGKLNFVTEFYYGGNSTFLNMKEYLLLSDFQKIYDSNSFPDSLKQSDWGIYDHSLFDKFIDDHTINSSQPFFSVLLTLSSHEPFKVPTPYVFKNQSVENDYYNSINYVDSVLADFLKKSKMQPWWENTLIVIVGDHGHRFPKTDSKFDDYKIPLYLTGGAVKNFKQVKQLASQVDIPQILLNEFNIKSKAFMWSKNPLHKSQPEWAYFTYNNGFGLVTPTNEMLFDNIGKKDVYFKSNLNRKILLRQGKSIQQVTYSDYLEK